MEKAIMARNMVNVKVERSYVTDCICCNVNDQNNKLRDDVAAKASEQYPDEDISRYDINTSGVPGYKISDADNNWNATKICEPCFKAMVQASKVLIANNTHAVSVTAEGNTHTFEYEEYKSKNKGGDDL